MMGARSRRVRSLTTGLEPIHRLAQVVLPDREGNSRKGIMEMQRARSAKLPESSVPAVFFISI